MADTQAGRLMQHTDKAMSDFMALTEGLHLPTANPPLNLLVVQDLLRGARGRFASSEEPVHYPELFVAAHREAGAGLDRTEL
jgi:hypothetical protein